jgi:hypothetical protein
MAMAQKPPEKDAAVPAAGQPAEIIVPDAPQPDAAMLKKAAEDLAATAELETSVAVPGQGRRAGRAPKFSLLDRVIQFSKSGLFFILLGSGFLWFAYVTLKDNSIHPTFTFILALLGISIVLYGTGTQSIGSGEFGDPANSAKAKVYIAGGAGVLAAVFGFGAVFGANQIVNVFSRPSAYALVSFVIKDTALGPGVMQQSFITAQMQDSRIVPSRIDTARRAIDVLVPVEREQTKVSLCIAFRPPDGAAWTPTDWCPNVDLLPNGNNERPEPVQSYADLEFDVKPVQPLLLDQTGRMIGENNFVAQ